MPVGIEGAEVIAGSAVVNFVKAYLFMPRFSIGRSDLDTKETRGQREKTIHDLPDREVRAECFVVEIKPLLAATLGPVGGFPGVKRPGLASGLFCFVFLQLFLLGIEQIEDFIVKVFGKAQRTLAILQSYPTILVGRISLGF